VIQAIWMPAITALVPAGIVFALFRSAKARRG
jgi:hypothetical protein